MKQGAEKWVVGVYYDRISLMMTDPLKQVANKRAENPSALIGNECQMVELNDGKRLFKNGTNDRHQ